MYGSLNLFFVIPEDTNNLPLIITIGLDDCISNNKYISVHTPFHDKPLVFRSAIGSVLVNKDGT